MKKFFLFLILAVGLCLSLCGCFDSKAASSKATFDKINRNDLSIIIADNKLSPISIVIGDKDYSCPTKRWIEKDFTDSYTKFIWDLGIKDRFTTESLDCDDIAQGASFWAKYLHWKETKEKRGLAFGEIHYFKTGYGWHALNIAIVSDGGKKSVVFYEPQKRFLVELSDKERASCLFIRF